MIDAPQSSAARSRLRPLLLLCALALAAAGCPKPIGYPFNDDDIKPHCRAQPLRLAVATFGDVRPIEEKDFNERVRLVGDDESKGYTNFGDAGVAGKVSDVVAKHLGYAGCFTEIDRIDLASDENVDYLKRDIKKYAGDYDAVLLGSLSHLWGFNGTTTEGDRRVVKAGAELVDLKIIRTRDLKLIWSSPSERAAIDELESSRPGNQYRIANDTLRDSINRIMVDLNKTRLSARGGGGG